MADAPLIDLELITPEATVLAATPEMVVVPGSEGEFGVLRDHAPILSSLRPGIVQVHATFDAEPECYFVTGGFTEAGPAHCLILADAAVPVSEIDVAAADRAVAEAEEAVREAGTGTDDAARDRADRALEIATARRAAAG